MTQPWSYPHNTIQGTHRLPISAVGHTPLFRDWSLITGREGGLQNGREGGGYKMGGGAREVLPLQKGGAEKVLAMLKGGHKM